MTELIVNGYKLDVHSVSPLAPKSIEVQYRKKYPEPQKPTYDIESAGNVVETIEYTWDACETDEEKETYLKWKQEHDEWQTGLTYRLMRLFLTQGVTLKLTKKQEENIKAQIELLELEVPETEIERETFYLETFVIDGAPAMEAIMKGVMGEVGVKEEALEAAEALFPA